MSAGNEPRLHYAQSLALHAAVAERIRSDPQVIERARRRLEAWLAHGVGSTEPLLLRWREILARSPAEVAAVLTDPSEDAAWLRKASPFAGELEPRERERILRKVRAAAGRAA